LRRHAPDVQAVAAHQVPLDQRDLRTEPRGPGGTHQPRRPRPEHDELVAVCRCRVHPLRRLHVRPELLVVRVVRQQGDCLGGASRGCCGARREVVDMPAAKKVAAIVTVYRKWSHADVILRNLLDGYPDGTRPNLQLVSLYTDQVPEGDMSRDLA